jgi:hypothetical protein
MSSNFIVLLNRTHHVHVSFTVNLFTCESTIYSMIFQVVVPKTYHKYTSRKVLTTQWIDGEKLSQSTEDDVGSLVSVGVICYLKQVSLSISFCTSYSYYSQVGLTIKLFARVTFHVILLLFSVA